MRKDGQGVLFLLLQIALLQVAVICGFSKVHVIQIVIVFWDSLGRP